MIELHGFLCNEFLIFQIISVSLSYSLQDSFCIVFSIYFEIFLKLKNNSEDLFCFYRESKQYLMQSKICKQPTSKDV